MDTNEDSPFPECKAKTGQGPLCISNSQGSTSYFREAFIFALLDSSITLFPWGGWVFKSHPCISYSATLASQINTGLDTHTCTHIHICGCIHMHTQAQIHTHVHVFSCTHEHTCMHSYTQIYSNTYIHVCNHMHAHVLNMCIIMYTQTCKHADTNACTHIHMHTFTGTKTHPPHITHNTLLLILLIVHTLLIFRKPFFLIPMCWYRNSYLQA